MPPFVDTRRTLALVLAGGAGTRLGILTERRAKPALRFAGLFRLIDIPLTHLAHSGIAHVWVVEQYRIHSLNEQLANGRPWDLDRTWGGLRVLPPYEGGKQDGFAHGNADALYRHLHLVRDFGPDRIVVVSADHVYRLDFRDVLAFHHEHGADCTIVTTEVDRREAARFGVVEVEDDRRVRAFHYKPDDPPACTVTAEVFVFEADVLLHALDHLAERDGRLEDYGDQLLPYVVAQHRTLSYPLRGYWRDVGTPESYWQAHQDLLDDADGLGLDDPAWPLLTRLHHRLPARIEAPAHVAHSLVAPGAHVYGTVYRSVLGPGVHVAAGARVEDAVLLDGVRVEAGARVRHAILDARVLVGAGATVGGPAEDGKPPPLTLVGMDAHVSPGYVLAPGTHLSPAFRTDT